METREKSDVEHRESGRLTEVDGTTFHTDEAGAGPTLICLHGGGPGATAWGNSGGILGTLAKRFQVILLDLPGFGGSVRGPGFLSSAQAGESEDRVYARSLLSFMDARGIDRAHMFGTSMSGACVLRLAIDHPDRVGRLVLKGPAGMPNPFGPALPTGLAALFEFGQNPTREQMAKVMRLFVPNPAKFTEEMVDLRFAAAQSVPGPAPAGPMVSVAPELSAVAAPVLVLWGRDDHMVPFAGALTLLDSLPDVRLHVWGGGTGHFPEWEHPGEFARTVIDFLDS